MHIPSVFSTEYFISQLEDAGALQTNPLNNADHKTLVKVRNLTVGLVLAAKAVDKYSNSDIVKWIRKDRKLTPILSEQLLKYNELAYYLMNEIEEVDVKTWKSILSSNLYTWPSSQNENDWANVFGDKVPEICKKIDRYLKNKVKSALNNSANSKNRVSQDDSNQKEETKIEKSEDGKIVRAKPIENRIEEDSTLDIEKEMTSTENVQLMLESEIKQVGDDVETFSSKKNFMNKNSLKDSEDEIIKGSDRSCLDEDADQLDFLFNDDEELDYEYDAVNAHGNKDFNENSDMNQSDINEDEELDYEYDITNSDDIEESNEKYSLKESENNDNEVENSSKFDNDFAKSSEEYPQNAENHSNNVSENDEDDFDYSNFDDLVVVDAEGDSEENEWDATDDEENEENSREWRFKGRSSSDKERSKSFSNRKESKNTIKDKYQGGSKSKKEKLPDRFEKIVMIADKLYKEYVNSLYSKNEKIVLIADDKLTAQNLPGILDRNKHKGEKNSLWIIVTGMYSLLKIKDLKRLAENYIPHIDNTELKKFSVSALIKEGREMRRIIASCLSESCAVVSCPPIPAALLVNQKGPIKDWSYDLKRFSKEWTRMAQEFFERQGLEYNYRLFSNYLDNVGGIYQIRYVKDDSIKENFQWKMLLRWYEIVDSIMRFNVIREKEHSQPLSSKSASLKSASLNWEDKATSRLEFASEEKSNLHSPTKNQGNSPEKRIDKEKDPVKEIKESNIPINDNLILREKIEPSEDVLVVVIGEEKAAREFCKMKIPKIRFKIVIVRRFDYRDINSIIPGNHLKSENIFWIVLCNLSRLYEYKFSFCNKFSKNIMPGRDNFCAGGSGISFASQLQSHELMRKCRNISDFAEEIREKLGRNSFVCLAPVIPQSVLHCKPDYKTNQFHKSLHKIEYAKSLPIFQPFAPADEESFTKNFKIFEKEWLKAIENIMRKQNLNFEMIRDYEINKGKVIEVLTDPWKCKSRTKSYKEWEIFMEALIATFRLSLCYDGSLTKEIEKKKSERINDVEKIDNENEIEAEMQIDKVSCNSNDDIVANQISIDNIPNVLKTEDFEKILSMCGKFSDVEYKRDEKLFLFRDALVTFMNANSVLHATRLLNGKYIHNGKLSVKEINKRNTSPENCDEIDLMLMNYDEEFVKKTEESINKSLKILGISIGKEPNKDLKRKSENQHKDSKEEKQHGKLQDSRKGKEEGERSKSSKLIKDSQSLDRKKRNSKDPEEKNRNKNSDTLKRDRNVENGKSRSCSPIRKRCRTDDKLKDNYIQFTNINDNNREILRLMAHFLAQFGGSRVRLSKSDERIIFRFKTKTVAKLLSKLLCNIRFPDKHLQVLSGEDSTTEVDNADLQFIAMHLDLVLKRIPHFAKYLAEAHSLWPGAFNLFTFKTKKCMKTHPIEDPHQRKLCVNFHGFTDSRRDPREYHYDSENCPESRKSKDAKMLLCPNGKECRFSHTMLERVFHMSTLKKNVCMDWYQTQSCNADRNCALAHPETPEVLFHDVWRDVYVSGLEKTYQYLVGAVQNLRHVLLTSQYGSGMQVLVVSPSVYVVEWLATGIKKLAEDHKLRVATAADQNWETGTSDIVVATPGGALKLLYSKNDVSMSLKGLILDDIGQLLKTHMLQLTSIAQTLINQRGKEDIQLNRVVVSEAIYQDEVDNMASILQTDFTVLGTAVNGSPPQMPVDKETDFEQIVISGKPLFVDDLGVRDKMQVMGLVLPEAKRTSPDTRIDAQTAQSGQKRQQHRNSPSGGRQHVRSPSERRRHGEPSGQRRASSPESGRSRSPRNNRTRSPSLRDSRNYHGDFGRSDRSRDDWHSPESGLLRDSRSSSRPRDSQFKSFSPRSSRNWSPDNKQLHSGNSIYENFPYGGPPDYNNVSRNGGAGFGKDNIGGAGPNLHDGGTSSSEPAAPSPWSTGPTHLSHATDDWRGTASAEVAASGKRSSNNTTFHSHDMAYPNLSVLPIYDTCSMLTKICDDLGIIGISFKSTLQKAMQYRTNRNRMLETFQAPEVKSLMEVVVRKIKELIDRSLGNERERCKLFLHHMTILTGESQAISQQLEASTKNNFLSQPLETSTKNDLYGLNIESIAKDTLGKDNPFVISDIQDRLLAAQGRVDSNQFSEIFKAVSMLHFDMMIKDPNSGGITSTHTIADTRAFPDKNSSLLNQDISSIDKRQEHNKQGYVESNRSLGNEWESKQMGYVESNRGIRGNIQEHSGISMHSERKDKYDSIEAGINDDYRNEKDFSCDAKRGTRNERVSPFGAQVRNNSNLDIWNKGIKGMEQILGSSLMKGEKSLQNSTEFSSENMQYRQDRQSLHDVLNRELVRNSDSDGISGCDRWGQGRGLGSANTNLDVRQGERNMGPAIWEHQQQHDRGSIGTQYGSTMDERRQSVNFDKTQDAQSFPGPDKWSNSIGKNNMDRNVVDYGHQGSSLSDRKVLDYGHHKEASVNSTFKSLDYSENAMDSRYRPGPGSRKSLSSAMSNNMPFLTTPSTSLGSQHMPQYDAEEHYSRIAPTGQRFEEHVGSRFSNHMEHGFNDSSQPGSRFDDHGGSLFGTQHSARFDEQQQGPRFGSFPRHPGPREF